MFCTFVCCFIDKKNMKIADKLKNTDKTLFSFEIVPPLKGNNIEKLYEKLDRLVEFNPTKSFIRKTKTAESQNPL